MHAHWSKRGTAVVAHRHCLTVLACNVVPHHSEYRAVAKLYQLELVHARLVESVRLRVGVSTIVRKQQLIACVAGRVHRKDQATRMLVPRAQLNAVARGRSGPSGVACISTINTLSGRRRRPRYASIGARDLQHRVQRLDTAGRSRERLVAEHEQRGLCHGAVGHLRLSPFAVALPRLVGEERGFPARPEVGGATHDQR